MKHGFTASLGALSLLGSAGNQSKETLFTLNGDLSQMSAQEDFLRNRGMNVGRTDVYPGLHTEEDFKKALTLIWQSRVSGWWHYLRKYTEYKICTEDEFNAALNIECEKKK